MLSLINGLPTQTEFILNDAKAQNLDLKQLEEDDAFKSIRLTLDFVDQHDVDRICVLLRVHLYKAIKFGHITTFYDCFEAAVNTLDLNELSRLVLNLFNTENTQFVKDIRQVSSALWSINFLQILKTLYTKLERNEDKGLCLAVIAKVKGFAHRARLNRKSLVFSPKMVSTDIINSPEELISFVSSMQPAAMLKEQIHFVGDKIIQNVDLISGLVTGRSERKQFYTEDLNWVGLTWQTLTVSAFYRLIGELNCYAENNANLLNAVSELVSRVVGKMRIYSIKQKTELGDEFFTKLLNLSLKDECQWRQWKRLGCPDIEFSKSEVNLELHNDVEIKDLCTKLNADNQYDLGSFDETNVCNEKVSEILKTNVSLKSFKPTSIKSVKSGTDFQSYRAMDFADLLTQFDKSEPAQNTKTLELEQQLKTEKEEQERLKKEQERKQQEERELKRLAEDDGATAMKRRLFDDRGPRGAQVTKRPLPY